ncbi:hypothetical protein TIFTF001_030891 [Ficus carica]|uniref:Uncharacterized protein n=1 Tax=Ficus carica TaxID=3494 RepID=A0AA88DTY2_FICCA|nr:hypothetical protein TIFTF001_030891 [Ficus carica]
MFQEITENIEDLRKEELDEVQPLLWLCARDASPNQPSPQESRAKLPAKPARISSQILSQARTRLQLQLSSSPDLQPARVISGPRDFQAVSSAKPAPILCQLQPRPSFPPAGLPQVSTQFTSLIA